MTELYLITGFLGAGKTTFLKNFIRLFGGRRLHLIINEFGKEGVDGALLREVGAAMDEINNGSIFCTCRLDRFEEVLQNALTRQPEIIIVEASGLSNPLNVHKILGRPEMFCDLEYKGCICIIDARQFPKVYETASVVKKQISVSDLLLINKTDTVTTEQLAGVRQILLQHRRDIPIYETVFGKMDPQWLEAMSRPTEISGDIFQTEDITLRKYTLYVKKDVSLDQLQKFLEMFLENTYRVKGFVRTGGKSWLIDCVGSIYKQTSVEAISGAGNYLVVLSGSGLPAKREIKKAMEWYPGIVDKFEM